MKLPKEKVEGLRHAATLETIAELALLLAQQGRAAEAAAVYADALQGESLGPQIPATTEAVEALSSLVLYNRHHGQLPAYALALQR